MNDVYNKFNSLNKEWESHVKKFAPFYEEMVNILISCIPFDNRKCFNAIDLGCGTGTIAEKIKKDFPKAKILCTDLAPEMLNAARIKLAGYNDIAFEITDLKNYKFKEQYNLIYSSLTIHHMEHDDQFSLYSKIFDALKPGGIFATMETALASNNFIHEKQLARHRELIRNNCTEKELAELGKSEVDKPLKLTDLIEHLRTSGFADVDIIWRNYRFAVICGSKIQPWEM